jgi:hypothetical protein
MTSSVIAPRVFKLSSVNPVCAAVKISAAAADEFENVTLVVPTVVVAIRLSPSG